MYHEVSNQIDILSNQWADISNINLYIEESGINGRWHYRKWSDGRLELFATNFQVTGSSPVTAMGGYYSYIDFSVPFSTNPPQAVCSARISTGIGFASIVPVNNTMIRCFVCGNTNSNLINVGFIHAFSMWK